MEFLLILFIFLLVVILISINIEKELLENFSNCNKVFKSNSFCAYDLNLKKCKCKYQKDDIKINFNSFSDCCKRNCNELNEEECLKIYSEIDNSYYCNIEGECKEFKGTIDSDHISGNNCGTDPLNNQLLLPFSSLSQCKKNTNVCDKYNNTTNSTNKNKNECIKNSNCGFCTNNNGNGKCVMGTESGPLDLRVNYYCNPTKKNNNNSDTYTYGNHAAYII